MFWRQVDAPGVRAHYAETLSSEPLVELDVDPVVLVVESLLSSVLRLELDDDPSSL